MTPSVNLDLGDTRAIMAVAKQHGLLRNQLAYVLATAYWETARRMKPVVEACWLPESWRKKHLRYYPWYGRGYVQLTWKRNYIEAGRKLGMDLTTNPNVVKQPKVAAEILVRGSKEGWFTGKRLSDYITLKKSDFTHARKIINGMDKAATIAEIARDYDAALKQEGYGEESTPAFATPAERVAHDANKPGLKSSTSKAVGVGGITTALLAAKPVIDAVNETKDAMSGILNAGPWVLLAIIGIAAGFYIWKERQRKAKMAKEVL